MAYFIGIDLGTTYSVISFLGETTGRPKIIHNDVGDNTTPSCILFEGDSVLYVGKEAKIQIGITDNIAARFKRDMGSSQKYIIDGHTHTPTTLSSEIIKKIYKDAYSMVDGVGGTAGKNGAAGESGDPSEVVITVPANFAHEARVATKEAAKLAGIKVVKLIDEPTAAALYYAFENRPLWFRLIWMVSDVLRRVISRFPHVMRYYSCQIFALIAYCPFQDCQLF